VYGTDGSGGSNLIVPAGGFRQLQSQQTAVVTEDENGNQRSRNDLYMDGSEIFTFTLTAVPKTVKDILELSGKSMDEVDLFVFHQANQFMLDHLRKKLKVPAEKFFMSFTNYGNTVSSTIPIALKDAVTQGALKSGNLVMLVGFGVGYSWGATLVRWS
jgi:3-oxoacyl-[acyl-carrier-protein] synthase III